MKRIPERIRPGEKLAGGTDYLIYSIMADNEIGIIETRSLSEQVYGYLCSQIIEGNINYGETLNIKLIAKELSVSSMPVREAIKRLEMEGLVRIKPRSTCVFKYPTRKSIRNALELREMIELHGVEASYEKADGPMLIPLRDIIAKMKKIIDSENQKHAVKEYIKLDKQFHTELCRLAGNDLLDKFYRETNLQLNMNFIYDLAVLPDIRDTYRDHVEVVKALSENSREAVRLLKKHLLKSRRNVLEGRIFTSLEDSPKEGEESP